MNNHFSIGKALAFGWSVFKLGWKFIFLVWLVIFLVTLPGNIASRFLVFISDDQPLLIIGISFLLMLFNILLGVYLKAGRVFVLLQLSKEKTPKISAVFSQRKKIITFIGVKLLLGLITLLTLGSAAVVSIVVVFLNTRIIQIPSQYAVGGTRPGLEFVNDMTPYIIGLVIMWTILASVYMYISLRLQFADLLIVDKGFSTLEALSHSYKITSGHVARLFLFKIIGMLLTLVSLLALLIGIFVSAAVLELAKINIYLQLTTTRIDTH